MVELLVTSHVFQSSPWAASELLCSHVGTLMLATAEFPLLLCWIELQQFPKSLLFTDIFVM